MTGILTDIGLGGLGLMTDRPLAGGSTVVLVLGDRANQDRKIEAVVVWSVPVPTTGRIIKPGGEIWRVGLKLAEGPGNEQAQLIHSLIRAIHSG